MASKRRNMFHENKKQEAREIDPPTLIAVDVASYNKGRLQATTLNRNLGGFCIATKTFVPSIYQTLLKMANKEDCPIEPGKYEVNDFGVNVDVFWPFMYRGTFRLKMMFLKDSLMVGCKIWYLQVK
ncbi:hypothetical protein AAG570_006104 [Ranatra chinensis]|uniref:Uncharacterized protein n=1 Tax=Ranatra chinensis TaxID=642074 RepID=A0ABD0YIT0_9HEMI